MIETNKFDIFFDNYFYTEEKENPELLTNFNTNSSIFNDTFIDFSSNNNQMSSEKETSNINRKNQRNKIKHWTNEENKLYYKFLEQFPVESSLINKKKKIFKQMAEFIKTKNPNQCRSHHQKFSQKQKTKHLRKIKGNSFSHFEQNS